jgi:nitrogen regulatory protein PII-like uncharacterized protein
VKWVYFAIYKLVHPVLDEAVPVLTIVQEDKSRIYQYRIKERIRICIFQQMLLRGMKAVRYAMFT